MPYTVKYYCVSHIGNVRKLNQDTFFCADEVIKADENGNFALFEGITSSDNSPIFAVFDGMGGEESGEIAAMIAAESLLGERFPDDAKDMLINYFQKANTKICEYAKENGLNSMGTTAALLTFGRKNLHIANIGDSKIFGMSGKKLTQISHDHVSIAPFGTKPPLSQNLGIPEDKLVLSPYIVSRRYGESDIYLICSDGLTDMVSTEEIARTLSSYDGRSAAEMLLEQALENGGRDNVTIQLLYVSGQKEDIFTKIHDFFEVQTWRKR